MTRLVKEGGTLLVMADSNSIVSYLKRVGKSVAFAGKEVFKEYTPNTTNLINKNEDYVKSLYKDISKTAQEIKQVDRIKDSAIFSTLNNGWKNLKTSIATGNFYDEERADEADQEAAFAALEFMDSLEGGESESVQNQMNGVDSSDNNTQIHGIPEVTKGDQLVATYTGKQIRASTNAISKTIANAADLNYKTSKLTSNLQLRALQQQASVMMNGFNSLNNGINSLVSFNDQIQKVHVQNSRLYFETMTNIQQENNAILKEMLDMQRQTFQSTFNPKNQNELKPSDISALFDNGQFNLQAYLKAVQGRANKSLPGMMIKALSMLPATLGTLMANPLHLLTKKGIEFLIDNNLKRAIYKLDSSINSYIETGLVKLTNYAKDRRYDGGIWSSIAKIFGFKEDKFNIKSIDTSKYHKGALQWNGIAQRALVEVIPGHLRRIEAVLSGDSERVYDFNSGKWTTMKHIQSIQKDLDRKYFGYAMHPIKSELMARFGGSLKNSNQRRILSSAFDEFSQGVAKRGMIDFDHIQKNKNKYGSDSDLVDFILLALKSGAIDRTTITQATTRIAQANRGIKAEANLMNSSQQSLINEYLNNSYSDKYARGINSFNDNTRYNYTTGEKIVDKSYSPLLNLDQVFDKRGNSLYDYQFNILNAVTSIKDYIVGKKRSKKYFKKHNAINTNSSDNLLNNNFNPDQNTNNTSNDQINEENQNLSKISRLDYKSNRPLSYRLQYQIASNERYYGVKNSLEVDFDRMKKDPEYRNLVVNQIVQTGIDAEDYRENKGQESIFERLSENLKTMSEESSLKKIISNDNIEKVKEKLNNIKDKINDKKEKSFLSSMINAATIADKFKVLTDSINVIYKSPQTLLTSVISTADKFMYDFLFEKETGEKDENGKPINGFFEKIESTFMKFADRMNNSFNEWMKRYFHEGVSGVGSWVKDLLEMAGFDVKNSVKEIEKFKDSAKENLLKSGRNIFGIVKEAVTDTAKDIIPEKMFNSLHSLMEKGETSEDDSFIKENDTKDNKEENNNQDQKENKNKSNKKSKNKKGPSKLYENLNKMLGSLQNGFDGDDYLPTRARGITKNTNYGLAVVGPGEAIIPANLNPWNPNREHANLRSQAINEASYKEKFVQKLKNNVMQNLVSEAGQYAEGNLNINDKDLNQNKTNKKNIDRNFGSKPGSFTKIFQKILGIEEPEFSDSNYHKQDFINSAIYQIFKEFYDASKEDITLFSDKERKEKFLKNSTEKLSKKYRKHKINFNNKEFQEAINFILSKGDYLDEDSDKRKVLYDLLIQSGYEGKFDSIKESREKKQARRSGMFNGISQFSLSAFGTNPEKAISETNKYIQKNMSDITTGGIGGALLGTIYPLGGPLIGAVAGSAINLLRNNDRFQSYVFGDEIVDEKGNKTRKDNGLISRKFVDSIQKYIPDAKKYGITGTLAGLVLPFGPLGGLMIGAGVSFLKNNNTFQNIMFGEKGGLIDKDRKAKIKKAIPNIATATLGTLFLGPFGLMGNAVLGAGIGLLSTTESFKRIMLGSKDKYGVRRGGIAGVIRRQITEPFKKSMNEISSGVAKWFKDDIFNPISRGLKPIGRVLIGTLQDNIKEGIDRIFNVFEIPMGRKLVKNFDRIMTGVRKAGGVGKFLAKNTVGKIGSGVAHSFEYLSNHTAGKYALEKGYVGGTTAEERIELAKKIGKDPNDTATGVLDSIIYNISSQEDKNKAQDQLTTIQAAIDAYQNLTNKTNNNINRNIKAEIDNANSTGEKNIQEYLDSHKTEKNPHDRYRQYMDFVHQINEVGRDPELDFNFEMGKFKSKLAKSDLPQELKDQLMNQFNESAVNIAKFRNSKRIASGSVDQNEAKYKLQNQIANAIGLDITGPDVQKNKEILDAILNNTHSSDALQNDINMLQDKKKQLTSLNVAQEKSLRKELPVENQLALEKSDKQIDLLQKMVDNLEQIGKILTTNEDEESLNKIINSENQDDSALNDFRNMKTFSDARINAAKKAQDRKAANGDVTYLDRISESVAGKLLIYLMDPSNVYGLKDKIEKQRFKNVANNDEEYTNTIQKLNDKENNIKEKVSNEVDKQISAIPSYGNFAGGIRSIAGSALTYFGNKLSGKKQEENTVNTSIDEANAEPESKKFTNDDFTSDELRTASNAISQSVQSEKKSNNENLNNNSNGKNIQYTSDANGEMIAYTQGSDGTPVKLKNKDNADIEARHKHELSLRERSCNALESIASSIGAKGKDTAGKAVGKFGKGLFGGLLNSLEELGNMLALGLPLGTFLIGKLKSLGSKLKDLAKSGLSKVLQKGTSKITDVIKSGPGQKALSKLSILKKGLAVAGIAGAGSKIFELFDDNDSGDDESELDTNTNKNNNSNFITDSIKSMAGTSIGSAIGKKLFKNSKIASSIGGAIGMSIGEGDTSLSNIGTNLAINGAFDYFSGKFGKSNPVLEEKAKEESKSVLTSLKDKKSNIFNGTKAMVGNIQNNLKATINAIGKYIPGDKAKSAVNKLCEVIMERVTSPAGLKAIGKKLTQESISAGTGLVTGGIGYGIFKVGFAVSNFIDGMNRTEDMLKLKPGMATTGMKILSGLTTAICGAIPVIGAFIPEDWVLNQAISIIGPVFGITESYLNSLRKDGDKKSSDDYSDASQSEFSNTSIKVKDKEFSLFDSAKNFANYIYQKGKNAFDYVKDTAVGAAKWVKDKAVNVGKSIYNFGSNLYDKANNTTIGHAILHPIDTISSVFGNGKHKPMFGMGYAGEFYSQLDPAFAMNMNAPGDNINQTMADSGCGPVSATNAISALGRGANPKEAANYAIQNGYKEKDGGIKPGFFKDYLNKKGIDTENLHGSKEILSQLKQGNPVILMGKDDNGESDKNPYGENPHYVTATGVDNQGNITVQDPESFQPNKVYKSSNVLNKSSIAIGTKNGLGKKVNSLLNKAKSTFGMAKKSLFGRGEDVGEYIWNYLSSKGLGSLAIAGIMGNMQQESSFNPKIMEGGGESDDVNLDSDKGYGLCQWSFSRKQDLADFAQSQGRSSGDIDLQLDFMLHELSKGDTISKMDNSGSAGQAAYIFHHDFEGSADGPEAIRRRMQYAENAFQSQGKGIATGSTFSGSSGSSQADNKPKGIFGALSELEEKLGSLTNIFDQVKKSKYGKGKSPNFIHNLNSKSKFGRGFGDLVDSAKETASGIIDTVKEKTSNAVDWAKGIFSTNSPKDDSDKNSTQNQQQSGGLMQKFFGGASSYLDKISSPLKSVAGKVKSAISSSLMQKFGKYESLIGPVSGIFTSVFGSSNNSNNNNSGSSGSFNGSSVAVPNSGSAASAMQTALNGAEITSPYGPRGSGFHSGNDFGVDSGTELPTVVDGVVDDVGVDAGGYGNYIVVKDNNGYYHIFGHLTQAKASKGQSVTAGQVIAISGHSGHCIPDGPDGSHLHYGIYDSSNQNCAGSAGSVDPATYDISGLSGSAKGKYGTGKKGFTGGTRQIRPKFTKGSDEGMKINYKSTARNTSKKSGLGKHPLFGMGKLYNSTLQEDIANLKTNTELIDFPSNIKNKDTNFGISDDMIKTSLFGRGKYGQGFDIKNIINQGKKYYNIFRNLTNVFDTYKKGSNTQNSISKAQNESLGFHYDSNGNIKYDQKLNNISELQKENTEKDSINNKISEYQTRYDDIDYLSSKEEILNKISDIPTDEIGEYNKINDTDDLTVIKAKAKKIISNHIKKLREQLNQNVPSDKTNSNNNDSISKAQNEDKYQLGEDGSHGVGSNGKAYSNNDISYILNNSDKFNGASTVEDAIKILSKDKKYLSESPSNTSNSTSQVVSTPSIDINKQIQNNSSTSSNISSTDKLDMMIAAQNKTNELLSAIVNIASAFVNNKPIDSSSTKVNTQNKEIKSINTNTNMSPEAMALKNQLTYFFNNSDNLGIDTNFINPDLSHSMDVIKRMQSIASM